MRITPYNNYFIENSRIAGNHLPVGSIFGLLLLVFIVNLPLRLLTRSSRFSLSSLELAVIWMMLIVAVGIPSMGLLQFLLPCLAALRYFTTPENDWAETLQPHIPEWLVVTDTQAVTDFYEGLSPGGSVPWSPWIKPLLIWGAFCYRILFHNVLLIHNSPQTVDRARTVLIPLNPDSSSTGSTTRKRYTSQRLFQK